MNLLHRIQSMPRRNWLVAGGGAGLIVALVVASSCLHGRSRPVLRSNVGIDLQEQSFSLAFAPPPPPPLLEQGRLEPRRVIRTARVTLEVKDFAAFETACREMAAQYGYLSDLSLTRGEEGRMSAELTLRLAADRFDAGFAAFKNLGQVQHEEVKVEDITASYADLEARCLNKRTTAARLRELIANRAGKLSEVVEAEQALSEVTSELEGMEAQRRALEGQLAYSTVHAQVQEADGESKRLAKRLWEPFRQATREGAASLVAGLAWTLKTLITFSPWFLLAGLGAWGFRRWRRSKSAQPTKDSEAS